MEIDQFLTMFSESCLQSFDDSGKGRKECVMCDQVKDTDIAVLHALNTISGAGIFFTPNPTDGKGRKESNITEIKWAYVDLDHGSKEEMMERIHKAPLAPSMLIESKRGYHVYYKSDISKANWEIVIQGLIQYFDGDPAISSINEVLRVPGFDHVKDPDNPFRVKLISLTNFRYTEDSLIKSFPYISPQKEFENKYGTELEEIRALDIREVLKKLNVEIRRNQIFIDGEGSSMMINVKNNYINRFSGKPGSGSTIDAVMYFKDVSSGVAINWLREQFGIKKTEDRGQFISWEELNQQSADEIKKRRSEDLCEYHIPWINDVLGAIFPTDLIVVGADSGQGKSEVVLNLAYHNALRGKKILYYQLEMDNAEIIHRRRISRMNQLLGDRYIRNKDYYLNNMTDDQKKAFTIAVREENSISDKIMIYNGDGLNLNKFLETFKAYGYKSDLVVVDHLHYFSMNSENQSQEIGLIMREIKKLTRSGTPIVLVSHLVKRNKNNEPDQNDFFGSSNIGKEATACIMLARNEQDTTIYIKKSRMDGGGQKQNFTYDKKLRKLNVVMQKIPKVSSSTSGYVD
jgi:archaellum biogenesis ATPase FlaH